jgi:hypothetical protein
LTGGAGDATPLPDRVLASLARRREGRAVKRSGGAHRSGDLKYGRGSVSAQALMELKQSKPGCPTRTAPAARVHAVGRAVGGRLVACIRPRSIGSFGSRICRTRLCACKETPPGSGGTQKSAVSTWPGSRGAGN